MKTASPKLVALVRISAAVGMGDALRVRDELEAGAPELGGRGVEELLLQSHLFVGFPGALEALAIWREVRGDAARDPDVSTSGDGTGPDGESGELEAWEDRGLATFGQVYGGVADALRENIRQLHPEMEQWMIRDGYGKVLGRPGLELGERELGVAAVLAALDAPVQLRSHLRGALRTGVDPEVVTMLLREVLHVLGDALREGQEERIGRTWDQVRKRFESNEGEREEEDVR